MWIWLSFASAVLLGFYDTAKKRALRRNSVLWVLLIPTTLTTLFLSPFLSGGTLQQHLTLVFKAFLVTASWVSGLAAMKTLPLTTVSTMKASRPVFVVIFSVLFLGERLNIWQWGGIATVFGALMMLGRSSNREGIKFTRDRGILLMAISILTGASSALFDKFMIRGMEPMFLQSWSNLYIAIILAIFLCMNRLRDSRNFIRLKWDWGLVLIAVLITVADAAYFFAIREEDALLSVVSMIRRSSVVVSFICGVLIFKEGNIRGKAVELAIMMAGLALLVFGSEI